MYLLASLVMLCGFSACNLVQDQDLSGNATLNVNGTPSIQSGMYIRGTFANWNCVPMVEVSNKVWSATVTFGNTSDERFKFDASTDWSRNYGDTDLDGYAEQNGADIHVPAGTKATISFNEVTKQYSININPLSSSVTCRPGLDNLLFWMYGPYYYVVPVQVYKNGQLIAQDLIHPTSKDGVQSHFTLDLYSDYRFVIHYTNEQLKTILSLDTNVLIDNRSKTVVMGIKVLTNDGFLKTYDNVSLRGTLLGTVNSWDPLPMELVADYTWEAKVSFSGSSSDRFKFDIYNDWSLNFGDNNGDKVADRNGEDIYVGTLAGEYTISFNDKTKAYSIVAPRPFNGSVELSLNNYWTAQFYLDYHSVTLLKDGVEYTNLPVQLRTADNTYFVKSSSLPAGSYTAVYDGRDRFSAAELTAIADHAFYAETAFVISESVPVVSASMNVAQVEPRLDIVLHHNSTHPYPGWHDEAILDLQAVLYQAGVPVDSFTIKKYYYYEGMYSSSTARVRIWDLADGVYTFEVDTFADGTNYNGKISQIIIDGSDVSASLMVKATNAGQFDSVYPSMFLRSDTTGWNGVAMTLVADHLWKGNATFTNGNGTQVKFDVYNDWSVNFGDTLFRDGIADRNGENISLRYPTGTFEFFFNDETKAYWFSHK